MPKLPIDLIISLTTYSTPAELARFSYTSLYFFSIDNGHQYYWKLKLINDFGFNDNYLDRMPEAETLPFKDIYKQMYLLKLNSPKTFNWLVKNLIVNQIDIPSIYAYQVDLNSIDRDLSKIYLDLAVIAGNLHLINFLIQHGVSADQNTLHYAVWSENIDLTKYFNEDYPVIKLHTDVPSGTTERFMRMEYSLIVKVACKTGNIHLCKYLIDYMEPLNEFSLSLSLNPAIESGNLELIKYLITVKKLGMVGDTFRLTNEMLALAALTGKIDLIEYLITLIDSKNLNTYHFDVGKNGFFYNLGKSCKPELVEWTFSPTNKDLWEIVFGNNEFIVNEFLEGMLTNNNLKLIEDFVRMQNVDLKDAAARDLYLDASLMSNSTEVVEWVLSKTEVDISDYITDDKIRMIVNSNSTIILDWLMTKQDIDWTSLPTKYTLLLECGNAHNETSLEDLNLSLINYLTAPCSPKTLNIIDHSLVDHYQSAAQESYLTKICNYLKLKIIQQNTAEHQMQHSASNNYSR